MKIGIIGTGHIGSTLARKLSAAGNSVKVANSRGPETIAPEVLSTGARAVSAAEAVTDTDVVILSIPLSRVPGIAPLIAGVAPDTVVVDTSNYYPGRDGKIPAIEDGMAESVWVAEQLGRPVVRLGTRSAPDPWPRTASPREPRAASPSPSPPTMRRPVGRG